eukprot:11460261-Alexandrium_andersonii.AAC.1
MVPSHWGLLCAALPARGQPGCSPTPLASAAAAPWPQRRAACAPCQRSQRPGAWARPTRRAWCPAEPPAWTPWPARAHGCCPARGSSAARCLAPAADRQ